MSKLTGAALDRAVANAMGLKSVNNCEQWGKEMTEEDDNIQEYKKPYRLLGVWTYQDKCDIEDCVDMWRFEKIGDGIYVKHKRKENA